MIAPKQARPFMPRVYTRIRTHTHARSIGANHVSEKRIHVPDRAGLGNVSTIQKHNAAVCYRGYGANRPRDTLRIIVRNLEISFDVTSADVRN